ncbi:MAG: cytochrome c3 family protein [Myxococcales bacterium]|nr:cytochrome c3 family protein [Myxococcales bacterium]
MTLLPLVLACSTPSGPEVPEQAPAEAPDVPVRPAHEGLDTANPSVCAPCHEQVVAEWKESMHSRSHADQDPVFAGLLALRTKKEGPEVAEGCATCHTPLAQAAPDSAAGRVGVACGACHDPLDIDRGERPDERKLCMSCHDAVENAAGVASCTTGPENQAAGGLACGACHMPPTEDGRHKSHVFQGPHRAWYQDDPTLLKSALHVELTREGGQATLKVRNTTGHAFPTGFPGRLAAIRLTGADGFSASPPELVLKKAYVDAEGKPTLPPYAASLAADTRLQPDEVRQVTVDVPEGPLGAELVFHLVAPPAHAPLGIEGTPEAAPKVVPLATLP